MPITNTVIRNWLERDLTQDALDGHLAPAFEVDHVLMQILGLLSAGRYPILTGDAGVGKTAALHELARRAAQGDAPAPLTERRFLQFSIRQRYASLSKAADNIGEEMHRLVEALHAERGRVVPVFSDVHLAYYCDLEPHLHRLAARSGVIILAEGDRAYIDSMLEGTPDLEKYFAPLHLEEPGLERTQQILAQWAAFQAEQFDRRYDSLALTLALSLLHRFVGRGRMPRKVLDFLGQLGSPGGEAVTAGDVIERFCTNHRVPRVLVDPEVPLDLDKLEARFASRVLGQPEAVQAVIRMIGLAKAGLSDMRRPFGVFLFVGPTGVGKTHIAQMLAEYLFGGRDRLVRFNMADFAGDEAVRLLFGMPEQHGWAARGLLTRRLMGHPLAVLLLDEFEKAHTKVHDAFLQLFDEGSFINGAGETVSCRSTIVIATSNAGAEIYREPNFGFARTIDLEARDRELDRRLQQFFRFEFLNRFDQVVHFHPLSREDIRTIALRELAQVRAREGLQQRGLRVDIDDAVLDWLAVNGYDADYGARFLRRKIERDVTTVLAEAVVRRNPPAGSRIELTVRQNRIVARVQEPRVEAAPRRAAITLPHGTTAQTRRMDGDALREEAEQLLVSAATHLESIEAKRGEYSELLNQMNEPGFWDRSGRQAERLERFRALDVALRAEERLAAPLRRLADQVEEPLDTQREVERFARLLEQAAQALRDWQDRIADEGPASVWLVISSADPLAPADRWIDELTRLELAWCRLLHLTASIAAYEVTPEEKLVRAVIDAAGPGAHAFLSMEAGGHRFCRRPEGDLRASVEVIEKGEPPADTDMVEAVHPRRRGPFNVRPTARGRIALAQRGLTCELLGETAPVLAHLLADLERAWREPVSPVRPARVYNEDGTGARDPRTGVVAPHLRDVLRGRLDRFLEAWRHAELREG